MGVMLVNGVIVDLHNPRPEDFSDIEAIATSLSRIPRFCGNTNGTWTVAAHSVLVSHFCDDNPRLAMMGLLHDAAEIVTSDIPTPVKEYIRSELTNGETCIDVFTRLEDKILMAVYKAYDVVPEEIDLQCIKKADRMALSFEAKMFMTPKWKEVFGHLLVSFPEVPSDVWAPMVNLPDKSREVFLSRFEALQRRLQK